MGDRKRSAAPVLAAAPRFDRLRLLWAAGVFAGFLAVFSLSHDRTYYFDGLLQAGMIDSPLDESPPETTYEWNHFLWYPTGRAFYKMVHAVGIKWEGYETLQTFNSLIGAAGAALFFLILARLAPFPWAAAWTALACLGEVYWYRAAGAENHLAGAVWCLGQVWFILSYWENPRARSLLGMGAMGLLAAYYHLGNFATWGVAGLVVLLRRPSGRTATHLTALVLITVLGWLPYALVHHWFDPGGFSKWWTWSTALAHGYSPLAGGKGIEWDLWGKGLLTLTTLAKSVLFFEAWGWEAALRVTAFAGAVGIALFYGRPRPFTGPSADRRPLVFLIPFGVFVLLYTFWSPGNYRYWILQWASLCLFGGALSAAPPVRRAWLPWTALLLAAGMLAENNLEKVILPNKENTQAFLVEMSREIGRLTPVRSPVVISGRLETNLKPYIPYFARRNRLAIDLFAINAVNQKLDPMEWMNNTVIQHLRSGIPVYITQDALASRDSFADFNLPAGKIESLWNYCVLLPVKDFPGPRPNRLYLMWPPSLADDAQDVMYLQLKVAGLRDQAAAFLRARLKHRPTPALAAELSRLESGG